MPRIRTPLERYIREIITQTFIFFFSSLLYITHTYPNISSDVGLIARYMKTPHAIHQKEAKRILWYVRGIVQFGIHYSIGATPLLVGFTYSNWDSDLDDWKSTVGYVFTLGSRPITWDCKKQSFLALSLVEEEYHIAIQASKETTWLRQILLEFNL